MRNKLQSLLSNLNQGLIAREPTVKLALLTLLAGENILLVGPPGTGKSYIARRMAESLAGDDQQGDDYFEYLLTKFSTPEEIFGPLSISELKQDRFKRNTAGYLPTVKTAFLDEIFKSSSSILNSLLTILNERVYHNGADVQHVPLRALIAASNELPTEQTELSALYDRFLVRVFVDYVPESSRQHFFSQFEPFQIQPGLCITDAELAQIATAAAQVEIPAEVAQAIQQIWIKHKEAFKEDRRESLSDRRLVKVIQLLRVSAVTNGRTKMDLSDVLLLKDCLWNHQDNAEQVMGIILKELRGVGATLVDDISSASTDRVVSNEPSTQAPSDSSTTVTDYKHPSKNAVIKGFSGNGTKEDPLLIQTVQDLADLARPEVGLRGYCFKQVGDLDISSIKTWPDIKLVGVYDGNGFKIIKTTADNSTKMDFTLFSSIENSFIRYLNLTGIALAEKSSKSTFENCVTNYPLINKGEKVDVRNCSAEYIINDAVDCKIECCEGFIIIRSGINCDISHCKSSQHLVTSLLKSSNVNSCEAGNSSEKLIIRDSNIINYLSFCNINYQNEAAPFGGIALKAINSHIEKSYCFGSVGRTMNHQGQYFSGLIHESENSVINNNAIGEFYLSEPYTHKGINRALVSYSKKDTDINNNISLDSNEHAFFSVCKYNYNEHIDATLVSVEFFNQRYFENILEWDFDNIWIWNDEENRPALRHVGVGYIPFPETSAARDKPLIDVFQKQLKANIWI